MFNFERKHNFASDNASGVHPKILEAIIKVNGGHLISYGMDEITYQTQKLIQQHFGDKANTYFVFNGTAANVLGISPFLKSHEAIICSSHSHINLDECGAPEKWIGSKLLTVPVHNGKLRVQDLEKVMIRLGDQHHVQPKLLSITQPTEEGTIYTIEELKEISYFVKKYKLFFHLDGSRLAHAATFLNKTLKEITTDIDVDVVSFGGTKNGLLLGEAVIFLKKNFKQEFKFIRKQGLQLASKHRFISAQFYAYLSNNLWKEISKHSRSMAKYLAHSIENIPEVKIIYPVESNAIFAKLPKSLIKNLRKHSFFYIWDEKKQIVRWMTSFDTQEKDIDKFASNIRKSLSLN